MKMEKKMRIMVKRYPKIRFLGGQKRAFFPFLGNLRKMKDSFFNKNEFKTLN
jgi:hypothetical protein